MNLMLLADGVETSSQAVFNSFLTKYVSVFLHQWRRYSDICIIVNLCDVHPMVRAMACPTARAMSLSWLMKLIFAMSMPRTFIIPLWQHRDRRRHRGNAMEALGIAMMADGTALTISNRVHPCLEGATVMECGLLLVRLTSGGIDSLLALVSIADGLLSDV